jgi:ribosomal-protein-alanine N-acetyltransferase
VLETERLLLRPICENDLDHLVALGNEPAVMDLVGTAKPRTREETAQRLQRIMAHWREHGFGYWALLDKAESSFAGWCGVGYWHELPDAELGYALVPRYWGRGLATEAVVRVLRHGFEVLRLPRVVGVTRVENVASQKVMLKAGMTLRQPYQYDGHEGLMYAIENPHLP